MHGKPARTPSSARQPSLFHIRCFSAIERLTKATWRIPPYFMLGNDKHASQCHTKDNSLTSGQVSARHHAADGSGR